MKQEDKLARIDKILAASGITENELVKFWLGQGRIDAELLIFRNPSGGISGAKSIQPGMIRYSNGLISNQIIPGWTVISIIGPLKDGGYYEIAPDQTLLPWADQYSPVGTEDLVCGREAARRILADAKAKGYSAAAANYCGTYAPNGAEAEKGSFYLAALKEMKTIRCSREEINRTLAKLHLPLLAGDYWSSTELALCCSKGCTAWSLSMNDNGAMFVSKNSELFVRPVRFTPFGV